MIIQVLKFGGSVPTMDVYTIPSQRKQMIPGITKQSGMRTTFSTLATMRHASRQYALNRKWRTL